MTQPYMDRFQASLNPCSLETISLPVTLANGRQVWPCMLSCYQLDDSASVSTSTQTPTTPAEAPTTATTVTTSNTAAPPAPAARNTNNTRTSRRRRRGRVDFYAIDVPDLDSMNHPPATTTRMPLCFGNPYNVLGGENQQQQQQQLDSSRPQQQQQQFSVVGGVLDGKWAPILSSSTTASSSSSFYSWAFATAHSTGEIQVHSFQVPKVNINNNINNSSNSERDDDQDDQDNDEMPFTASPAFTIHKCIGQSAKPNPVEKYNNGSASTSTTTTTTIRPLCISVNWANKQINHHHQHDHQHQQQQQHDDDNAKNSSRNDDHQQHQLSQIVSTYSNGWVAIHDVAFLSSLHLNCSWNSNPTTANNSGGGSSDDTGVRDVVADNACATMTTDAATVYQSRRSLVGRFLLFERQS
jgi:hypothetical protein